MGEDSLEKVMVDFVGRQHDVLVATTIIENGLDIPNANTMIVNRADRYGLAQLYQLRGRVGRSDRRAYAYLLIPPEEGLSPVARKRLAAIKEFSDLGSGFRVAALDLEIRGAGNLLGGEQSGHIEAIGFEMYLKLLEETVRELKGEPVEEDLRAALNLKVQLRIDEQYIPDVNQRLTVYRRLASTRTGEALEAVLEEVRDRYGPLVPSILVLAGYARLRMLADELRVESIDREGPTVVLKFRQDAPIDPVRLLSLLKRRPDVQLQPPASLKLDLRTPVAGAEGPAYKTAPAHGTAGPAGRLPIPGRSPAGRSFGAGVPSHGRGAPPSASPAGQGAGRGVSWWTARAKAGEVAPGFTKQEILREAPQDPLASGGLFERVGALLDDLARSAGR
jgi:transcription-repair coupling factor (superfamily II helicase)